LIAFFGEFTVAIIYFKIYLVTHGRFIHLRSRFTDSFFLVMFFVTATGQYNDDDIPKYENGTLQVCTDAEITTYTEYQCTQYASLTARNPSSCIGYLRVPTGWTLAPNTADTKAAILAAAAAGVNFGSTCVVLADGSAINVNTGASCGAGFLKTFPSDGTCFNVDCQYTMIIKGQTLSRKSYDNVI
jgi:hypothetical protein